MISRSVGMTTGYGYLVGSGYEGKTKELDKKVMRIGKRLEKEFNMDVEIRFNSDRESGGGFIKAVDKGFDYTVGINARLCSSEINKMPREKLIKLSSREWESYEKDTILFGVVLGEKVCLIPKQKIWEKDFKTLDGAVNCLYKYLNREAMNEYLKCV